MAWDRQHANDNSTHKHPRGHLELIDNGGGDRALAHDASARVVCGTLANMTDRNTNTARPLRPTVAAPNPRLVHRNTAPLTPRVAARAPSKTPSTVRSEPATKVTPRLKQVEGSADELQAVGNVTPRSSARKSRLFERESTVSPSEPRESGGTGGIARVGRPRSLVTGQDGAARGRSPPLVRSPGMVEMSRQDPGSESIDARFFHASDMPTAAPPPQKKPETKRTPTFVYADGQ